MPESPPIVTSAEIAQAISDLGDNMTSRFGSILSDLLGSLQPGTNVREMAADSWQVWQVPLQPGESSRLLVPAQENRLRVLLFGPTTVGLCAQEGQAPGSTTVTNPTMVPLLGPTVQLELQNRAPIYAGNAAAALAVVTVVAEYADRWR